MSTLDRSRPSLDDGELERGSQRVARAAQLVAVVLLALALGVLASSGRDPAPPASDDPSLAPRVDPDSSSRDESDAVSQAPADAAVPAAPKAPPTQIAGGEAPAGMVAVPAGPFIMGRADGGDDERPPHEVSLGPYFIDATEVTVGAFLECVRSGPCRPPGPHCPGPGADRPTHPVACVDWSQAQSYCAWVGKRLPTEAEWEKAARGTDQRAYPWGEETPTCARASFNDRGEEAGAARGCGRGASWPVGSFPSGASPYGALDMAGNVWEWVADRWAPDYYAQSPRTDPAGPQTGDMHVRRGGSWRSLEIYLPSAVRGRMDPAERNEIVGFRCAKSP